MPDLGKQPVPPPQQPGHTVPQYSGYIVSPEGVRPEVAFGGLNPPPQRNGLGSAALVVAVIALVTAWTVIGGVACGAIAVVLGMLGHGRVRRGEANNGGIAIAGAVLGALALLAGIACGAFFYFKILKSPMVEDYVDCMTRAESDSAAQQECIERFREHFEQEFAPEPVPRAP